MRAVYSKLQTRCATECSERPTPAPTTQYHQLSPITSDLAASHAGPKLPITTSPIPTLQSPRTARPFRPPAAGATGQRGLSRPSYTHQETARVPYITRDTTNPPA